MTEKREIKNDNIIDRNDWIRQELKKGVTPIVDFEAAILKDNFNALVGEQSRNAVMLGESMQDSSETWHDNAAAEMINASSLGLSSQASTVVRMINESPVCESPRQDYEEVTLGSVVFISFDDDIEHLEPFILTGATNDLPDSILGRLPDGCEAVTVKSPLGASMLGAKTGDVVTYQANNRNLTIHVHHFEHI